jgi:hypothetical protein
MLVKISDIEGPSLYSYVLKLRGARYQPENENERPDEVRF